MGHETLEVYRNARSISIQTPYATPHGCDVICAGIASVGAHLNLDWGVVLGAGIYFKMCQSPLCECLATLVGGLSLPLGLRSCAVNRSSHDNLQALTVFNTPLSCESQTQKEARVFGVTVPPVRKLHQHQGSRFSTRYSVCDSSKLSAARPIWASLAAGAQCTFLDNRSFWNRK